MLVETEAGLCVLLVGDLDDVRTGGLRQGLCAALDGRQRCGLSGFDDDLAEKREVAGVLDDHVLAREERFGAELAGGVGLGVGAEVRGTAAVAGIDRDEQLQLELRPRLARGIRYPPGGNGSSNSKVPSSLAFVDVENFRLSLAFTVT